MRVYLCLKNVYVYLSLLLLLLLLLIVDDVR